MMKSIAIVHLTASSNVKKMNDTKQKLVVEMVFVLQS